MTTRIAVALACVLAAAVALGSTGLRHGGRWREWSGRPTPERAVEHVLDRVAAPPGGRDRLRATLMAATRDLLARRQQAERIRAEVATAWLSDTLDVERLHALVADEAEELRLLGHVLVDDLAAVHDTLGSAARREVAGLLSHHRGGWR